MDSLVPMVEVSFMDSHGLVLPASALEKAGTAGHAMIVRSPSNPPPLASPSTPDGTAAFPRNPRPGALSGPLESDENGFLVEWELETS